MFAVVAFNITVMVFGLGRYMLFPGSAVQFPVASTAFIGLVLGGIVGGITFVVAKKMNL